MSIANDIQMLYIGYLGRAADEAGIEYWVNKVEQDGWSVDQVALSFADQVEYQQIYGAEPSREELLKTTYRQLFNREFDEAGLEYWLNGGGKTVPNNLLVQAFINGALGSDQQILANKLEVGNYYTDKLGGEFSYNQEKARDVVLVVDGLDSSVVAAKNSIDGTTIAQDVFTLQETYTDPDYVPAQTEIYWGYNPCDPCPEDGTGYSGIPVDELLSFLQSIAGQDFFELGLIDDDGVGPFDNVTNLTLTLGTELSTDTDTQVDNSGTGNTTAVDGGNSGVLTVYFSDGTSKNAEVELGDYYMTFLRDLMFYEDANGLLHSRLFEKVVVEATGSETGELQAIMLTPDTNNGGTVETGYTSERNELIVAGRLELLHGAYIDGGAGTNTLEIDAKGVYAQPLALLNIQHILIENLPNIYTTWTELEPNEEAEGNISGTGIVDDQYPYFNDVAKNGSWGNSIIDLSRAIDIETLTITEGRFDGFENNGQPGSLTVAGIRNGVTTTLDGGFSQNVYLHYSAVSDDAGVNLVFHNLNMDAADGSAQLIVAHNSDTLNIESTGGGNWLHNADLGGRLSNLNITGDAHLFIQHDLDPSFHDESPVTINASGNTGGVTLTLSGSQNVTYMGSSADDNIVLSTTDTNVLVANDETVTIVDTAGNNHYEVTSYSVNITDGDGDNNYEVAATKLNLNAGNGNNVIESEGGETAVIVVGDGDNTIDTDGKESVNINAGNGDNTITSIGSIAVEIATGTGNDAIMTSASIITINSGDGDDTVTLAGREGAGDVTGITGSPNLVLVLDGSGSMGSGPGSNLQAQADAVEALLNVLPDDAAIYVVYEYEGTNGVWSTKAAALAIADGLADGTIYGTWDTEGFIDQTEAAFADLTGTYNAGGANEVIFITDGGNQPADEQSWINFLVANDVRANTLGIGADSEYEINTINSLSYDGRSNMDLDGIIASTEELENLLEDLGRDITVMNGNGARVNIDLGEGTNVLRLGDAEDLAQGLVALEGSSITGENIKLVVNADSDLRAADLNGISSVVLDNDDVGSFDRTVDNGMLTLTAQQFADIGAANFSVEGSIFHTYAFVKIIVTEDVSLTDLGVDSLPRNIDLYLEIQDGATLTLTAEQLHTKVAQNGITLVDDGNFDEVNGKVVITGGGLDFDPFNTSDTIKTIIDGTVYNGGSLSSDFMVDGAWYNVSVKSVVNGYDRPADTPAEVILTIDTDLYTDPVGTQGGFSTWHTNLEIVGEKDVVFTDAVALGLIQGIPTNSFTVDFSQLDAKATELTLANFEYVKAIYGNSESGYDAIVNIQLGKDVADDHKGWDETDATSLVSSGVAKYIVTLIEGPTAAGSDGNEATIKLCDTTQDLEVLALRGNYNDTLIIKDAAWDLAFELQGGTTAKADGPTGTANVGTLQATYEWPGADAIVTLTHSVDGDTRDIRAFGIVINNARSISIDVDGSAIIDSVAGNGATALDIDATGNVVIDDALPTALQIIDASGVVGNFAATLEGVPGVGLTFTAAQDVTNLTLEGVEAGFHSSFTAEDAATFNLIVKSVVDGDGDGGEKTDTDLSAATLTNVDSLILGEIGSTVANVVTLSIAQVLDIGAGNIVLAHPGLNGALNIADLGAEAFDSTTLGEGVVLGQVVIAEGDITLDAATVLEDATVTVAAGSALTLTADQFMALKDLDGTAVAPGADPSVINITGLTQAMIDDGFTLSGVSNVIGTLTLAEDVDLAATTSLNGFEVILADGQTLGVATHEQAYGLMVTGGMDSTVALLFSALDTTTAWAKTTFNTDDNPDLSDAEKAAANIDVSGYDISVLRMLNTLVEGKNIDAILSGIRESVVKEIYNNYVELVDQDSSIVAGTIIDGDLIFTPTTDSVELEDFSLTLNGGTIVNGDLDLSASVKDTNLVQTYLKTVTINSIGTEANPQTGEVANILTGKVTVGTPVGNPAQESNELLNVTINADQAFQLGGIDFASITNNDDIAALTVTGTANVTIGALNTQDTDVDGVSVINNGTGTLTVGIASANIDASDALSFTGTGDIVLVISSTVGGWVDLSDADLTAVTEIVLTEGASLDLTMTQATTIGASQFTLAHAATAASLNLIGLDGEPFAVADYAEGIVVDIVTIADDPVVTLHPDTDLTGINRLVVPEGTVLNLTAAQFQQLGNNNGVSGIITGIKADGTTATNNYTVNITDLTQADVAKGFDLSSVSAANLTLSLAEDVAITTPDPLPADYDGINLFGSYTTGTPPVTVSTGADINIGAFQLTLDNVALANGLNITGTGILKFTDIEADIEDQIDASGFDVSELHMEAQLIAGQNVDLLFQGLAESVLKVVTDEYGYVVGTTQTVVIEGGSTISDDIAFIKEEDGVEIRDFTLTLGGGVHLNGSVNLSKDNEGALIPAYLQSVTIVSEGTAANVSNGETANVITGGLTTQSFGAGYVQNNLLDVTINATQELIIGGGVVFNSVTAGDHDDGVTANDIDDAVATLTVTGDADVTLGTVNNGAVTPASVSGINTADDDVDGLNVVNNGTGTLTVTIVDTAIDDAVNNNDGLSFTGTGDIVLNTVGTVNLSDDDLSAVSAIKVVEGGTLTLSMAQMTALTEAGVTVIDGPDADTIVQPATLVINGFDGSAFNATLLDANFTTVNLILTDADVDLTANPVNLTNVDSITVQEGRTLTLTAAQFQQLQGNGTINVVNTDGNATTDRINVIITDLTQADVFIDLNGDNVVDVGDSIFNLNGISNLADVTVTLGEPSVTLGHIVNGTLVANSASVFPAATTTFELVDGQTLGVVNYTQANGLNVDGTGDTTIVYKFSPLGAVLTATQIDASDYNVTTLRALANSFTTGGANNNVEFAIDDLPSSVELRLYADPSLLGFLDPTFRVVTIEAGVSTPGTLIFNDYDGAVVGDEVRTLTLNLEGDAQVSGDISIPTRTGKLGGTYQYFDTLTIKSEGTQANAITGNINTAVVENDGTNTSENNLLNVVINADQDLVIGTFGPTGLWTSGGDIIFNNRDTVVTNDVAANLTVTGAADVTMHGLDVTDNAGGNISVLNIVNNAATLTLTGGTAAIEGNHLEVLNLSGSGDIVMGSNNNGTGAEGIDSTSLSLINASGLTGDLTLAEILVDNANFALISGTGVTTLTVTGDTLAADFNGPDNIDGNADDDLGWSFDLSDAAAGSQLRLGANTYTSGDLAIDLGANATLYIDANTNWTALNSLSITGVQAIVLADDVTLTLTAAQASGLNIIAGPVLTAPYNGQVNIVNLGEYTDLNANGLNDDVAELFDYDFSGITVAATATLYDNDVTISAGSDLGTVAISLSDVADNFSTADVNELAGQTIRFNTEAQAARTINVPADVGGNTPSTNVVWLFESITGTINTNNYSPNLQRLWINEALIISEGGDAENLFTTLPNSILRVEFTDPAELPVLDSSTDINRVVELVAFTDVSASGLIFADQDRLEHVQNLNLLLGGEVLLGDLEIGNIVNPVIDPVTGHGVATPTFQTLTITSNRAVRTNDLLAPVDYVNDNDGVNETKANSDLDFGTAGDQTNANLVGNENVLPVNLNTIGDISIGTAGQYGLDLMNVVIATGAVTTTGDGSAGQGARLQIGTITFDNDAAAAGANLSVSGNNSVTIKSLDTSDADITALTVTSTMSGPDGILNVTGGSPGFDGGNATGNTETLTITNGTGTINFGSAKAAPATGFWAGVYGEELSTLTVNNGGGTVNLGRIGEVDNEAFTLNVTGTGPVTFTLGIADANGLKAPNLSATGTWSFTGIGATTTMTIENDPTSVLDDAMFVPGGVLNLTNLNVIIAGNVDLSVLGTGLNADTTNVTFMVPLGSVLTLTAEQADGVDVDGLGTVNIVGDYGQSTVGGAHDYDLSELANTTNINLSGITGLVDTDGTGPLVAPTAVTLNLTTETGAASFPHNVTGSNFADVITTGSGADTINSGAGNDVITAGAGADLIDGGAGNDTINGFTAGDTVNGGADLDTLQLVDPDGAGPLLAPTDFNAATDAQLVNVEIIEGTTGDDLINTTNQTENLTINGGNGADTIIAGGGNDSINGGAGADSIVAGAGNDTIVGAQDDVLLDGGIGADVLEIGADFNDTSDAQIVNIETVNLTAAGLTVTLDAQGSTVAGNNEGLVINAYANAALVTGVATNGTAGSPESSTYTLNALTAGQSITIAGFTVTATADATAAQVADAFRGATVTGLARTGAFTAAGWAGATLGGSGATLTFTNTVNGDVANLTASSTLGSIITGGADNDTINGGNGADSLTGGTGADSILAGAGNDTIVGAQDDVLLDGGTGTDTLRVATAFDDVSDAQIVNIENVDLTTGGVFSFDAQSEGLNIVATAASTITGGSGADTITGSAAADSIVGGAGADSIVAGGGADTIVGAQDDVLLDGGADADVLQIGANFNDASDAQIANIETVTLTAAGLNVSLDAQTEGMVINAFANYAPVVGVATNGTAGTPESSAFTLNPITAGQSVTINGLTVTATAAATAIQLADAFRGIAVPGLTRTGSSGTPTGWTGAALVGGTVGTDVLTFTNTVVGDVDNFTTSLSGPGATITGGTGADTINGSNGNDSLIGADGADSIVAGNGNDTIVGAQNDALLDGGAGADLLQIGANFDDANDAQIANIETVTLTATGLTVSLDAQTEGLVINGFAAGSSTIIGGSGADSITGGSGADLLTGGAGVDSIDGGAGNDTIVISAANDSGAETLTGGLGTDTLQVVDDMTINAAAVVSGFEAISLAEDADLTIAAAELADNPIATVTGTAGGATETVIFTGTADPDSINLSGITTVTDATLIVNAGADDDDIVGSAFGDILNGEAGQDTITGGQGNDTMTGGAAADTFVFIADGVAETDTITDWGVGGNNDAVAGALGAGDQLNVTFSPWDGSGASVNPTNTDATAGGNGVVNFVTSYKVGDVITITFNGTDSVSRTVQAGATSGTDVALAFQAVFASLTMGTSFDADLVDGVGSATVTAALDGSAVLYIVNDSGGDGAFTIDSTVAVANGYVFDASVIAATNGVVSVTGNDGADTITGGVGNDTIIGGTGADSMFGGDGNDTFIFATAAQLAAAQVNGGTGTDTIQVTGTTLVNSDFVNKSGFERLEFTGVSAHSVTLGALTNAAFASGITITSNTAAAGLTVIGTASTVEINATGTNNADTLTGGSVADILNGGAGDDSITGGEGADVINGGAGADVINLTETTSAQDTVFLADVATTDTITGFNVTAGDATEDLLVFDFSEIEGSGDYVNLDDAASAASTDAPLFQTITGAFDLGTATADSNILIANLAGNIANAGALETALEAGGGLALTVNQAWAVGDTFLAAYDDGAHTYIARVVVGGNGAADDETFAAGELNATVLVQLTGVTDVTALAASNFDFVV